MNRQSVGFVLIILFAISLASAQSAKLTENAKAGSIVNPDQQFQLGASVVQIPVTVVNRNGQFVSALTEENFAVYDEGVKQNIEFFRQESSPVAIGIIYDLSGSMKTKRANALTALREFLESAQPDDEFFAIGVNTEPVLLSDFSQNIASITADLASTAPRGRTALFDSVYLGLQKIRQSHLSRRVLLVISDGQDNHSRYRFSELQRMIEESDVQLYAVGMPSVWGYNDPLELEGRRILRALGELSGGEVIFARDADQFAVAFNRINAIMRSRYSLAYHVPTAARDGRWHKLKVQLVNVEQEKLRALAVKSRPGYWAAK